LLRYLSSRTLLGDLIESVLGEDAKVSFDTELLSVEDAFAQLTKKWTTERLTDLHRLGRGETIFATFEHPGGAPRDSAQGMADALAHPVLSSSSPSYQFLFELTYPTYAVTYHRIPTVADAGWFPYFKPAPEEKPDAAVPRTCSGWTEPFGGQVPQPELVHDNQPLKIVIGPPRLLGRLG
jgi:hypothetical protein